MSEGQSYGAAPWKWVHEDHMTVDQGDRADKDGWTVNLKDHFLH